MLFLSENDLKIFFGEVIRNVAKELKIKDWEWQFHSELLDQIKSSNPNISKKLDAFFAAYKDWHSFHVEADKTNGSEKLSPEQIGKLTPLIEARDTTRNELLSLLQQLS